MLLVQSSNGIVSMVAELTVLHAIVSIKKCPMNITVISQPKVPWLQLTDEENKRMQNLDIFLESKNAWTFIIKPGIVPLRLFCGQWVDSEMH